MAEALATEPQTTDLDTRGLAPRLYRSRAVPHYESFYLRAHNPAAREAFWVKYTLLRRLDGQTTASTWLTYWNAEAGPPQAFKETRTQAELTLEADDRILTVENSMLAPGQASGSAAYDGGSASWDLGFSEGEPAFFHLPKEKMYTAKLPRTKLLSPYPQSLFNGSLNVDGQRVEVEDWPGMVGHNWGTEHSERWIWMNCNEFEGEGADTYFDAAAGRVRIGSLVLPWLPVGMICIRGERHLFNGVVGGLRSKVHDEYTLCEMKLRSRSGELMIRVEAPEEQFIGFIYQDPDGRPHNTLNCSIADAEVLFKPRGGQPIELRSTGGASYEIGILEHTHPVQMAPFGDY